jgi:hypothetical protein
MYNYISVCVFILLACVFYFARPIGMEFIYCKCQFTVVQLTHCTQSQNVFSWQAVTYMPYRFSHKKCRSDVHFVLCTNSFLARAVSDSSSNVPFALQVKQWVAVDWQGHIKFPCKQQMLPNCTERYLQVKYNSWLRANCVSYTRTHGR